MQFAFAFVSLLAVAAAQSTTAPAGASSTGVNAFNVPVPNYSLSAGQPQTFTWSNPSQGTVTIYLVQGANTDLHRVTTLASSVPNSGSYTYNVPSDIVEAADYALEIVDDADTSMINYTPQFVISSPVHAVQTSGGSTSLLTVGITATGSSASMATATAMTMATSVASGNGTASRSGSAASSGAASTNVMAASASRTSGAAASGTPPSSGAAQGVKAASGLLALALGFALVL